jgi:hypothetical protein
MDIKCTSDIPVLNKLINQHAMKMYWGVNI